MNGRFIEGYSKQPIYLYCWDDVENVKSVVQIVHGMAEHAARYEELALFLNSKGIVVYASDHRGHGKTAGSVEKLGIVGDEGFNKIVEDKNIVTKLIKEKYSNVPVYILGHSFGSFLTQRYIEKYGDQIDGAILSGTAAKRGVEITAGVLISSIQRKLFGEEKPAKLLDKLSFGSNNKRIENPKYKNSWLSTDDEEVKKYEDDPYCGTLFTVGFFYYLFKAFSKMYTKENLDGIPKELPILIFAGAEDPVGKYGKEVKALYDIYKVQGIKNVELKLFEGKRHEVLNDTGREEAFNLIADFLGNR